LYEVVCADPAYHDHVLFNNEAFSDVVLKSSDKKSFHAHKSYLASSSQVFWKMFTTDMQEASNNIVEIKDFDSKVLTELLRFVYSSTVYDLDDIAFDLILAAEKYQIAQLKKICADHIFSKMTTENAFHVLVLFDQLSDMEGMFKKCVVGFVAW
jgi:hypothetical protein